MQLKIDLNETKNGKNSQVFLKFENLFVAENGCLDELDRFLEELKKLKRFKDTCGVCKNKYVEDRTVLIEIPVHNIEITEQTYKKF